MPENKSVTKKGGDKPLPSLTLEEAKRLVVSSTMSSIDSSRALRELAEQQFPLMLSSGNMTVSDDASKNIDKVSLSLSLETGHILAESVPNRYRGFALELKSGLEQEYHCTTVSEKGLVEQAVNAYIRKLSYSKLMEAHKEPEWLSHEKVAFLNFYSREVDRAHRQFLSAIETLRVIKQPAINVKVNAQNAFVAENQQLNNYPEKSNEAK